MTKKVLFIIPIIIIVIFIVYFINNYQEIDTMVWNEDGVELNNNISLRKIKWNEYSLDELTNFFGLNLNNEANEILFSTVNEKFPIQVARYFLYGDNKIYIIYKVEEGGYFIVYCYYSNYSKGDVVLKTGNSYYFNKLCSKKDFSNLKSGESTYQDVFSISSATNLNDNNNTSYTLLKNGKFLKVIYDYGEDKEKLIVKSFYVVDISDDDIMNSSYDSFNGNFTHLSFIYKKDINYMKKHL